MILKKIDKKRAEAKLYGNIGHYFSDGDFFTALLEQAEREDYEELTLRMHCYGGSVFEGNVIYNALQRSKLKISIIIDGIAASMGAMVLLAVEDVQIADNGFGMLHVPTSTVIDKNAADLENAAKLLRDIENNFVRRMTERTGKTDEEIREMWFDGADHWLNAQEMVSFGLAKKVISATAKDIRQLDKDIISKMEIENVYNRYTACLDKNFIIKNNLKMDKVKIIQKFGLMGVTAESSDEEILAKLQERETALNAKMQKFEADAKAKADAEIKALLDEAQKQGKVTADTRATFETVAQNSGVDALKTVLSSAKSTTKIVDFIKSENAAMAGATGGNKTWDWYQEHNPQALTQLEKEEPETFKALYQAKYNVKL